MNNCQKCHGLIMEHGKAYGYAGKVCHCHLMEYGATIKTDNTQTLYNALAEIEVLKHDRDYAVSMLERKDAEIDRLKRQVGFWSNEYKRLAEAGVERLRDFGVECDPASVMVEATQYRLSKIEKE